MKNVLKVSFVFIIIVIIVLNYVPIKFAKKEHDIKSEKNVYICNYVTATDGCWLASVKNNPDLTEDLYLNISNVSSFNRLKEIYRVRYGEPICNTYIFYGTVYKKTIGDDFDVNYIDIERWDIVYPIKRNSVRGLFTPPHYLNILDYLWSN